MESIINNRMCRCCASEGTFKDVKTLYYWMGVEEVYADMLRECFDIDLTCVEAGEHGGICEVCITQLRNASNFKKQVLQTEDHFKKFLESSDKFFKTKIIKEEGVSKYDNLEDDDVGAPVLDSDNGSDDYPLADLEIKQEYKDELKTRKRTAKAGSSKAKKSKKDGESTSKRVPQSGRLRFNVRNSSLPLPIQNTYQPKQTEVVMTAENKRFANIQEIMMCTNATLIRRHGDMGYMCFYCDEQYIEAKDLKQHTLDIHSDINILSFRGRRRDISIYQTKWDITHLTCNICHTELTDLEKAMTHLKEIHRKNIFSDVLNYMIPIKFLNESLQCYICSASFIHYRLLVQHMRVHYQNYTCEACGEGFVTTGQLRGHKRIHDKGNFPCEVCTKIFDTQVKLKAHVLYAHSSTRPNKCDRCSESFKTYSDKFNHIIKVHQITPKELDCPACDMKFIRQSNLRIHVEKHHLQLKNHKCPHCEKSFYKKSTMTDHMNKHTKTRNFQCSICSKSFGSKKTLRQHVKIHAGDKRFMCKYCNKTFTAKSSLQVHIRSRHPDEFPSNLEEILPENKK